MQSLVSSNSPELAFLHHSHKSLGQDSILIPSYICILLFQVWIGFTFLHLKKNTYRAYPKEEERLFFYVIFGS